jgi:hypothetical protein
MKKYLIAVITCAISALALTGCGGGGGSTPPAAPAEATKAVAKVFLFGNVTSSSTIVATVQTTMTVPSGVMVNYSSVPGATSGLCRLKAGVIVPSGKVLVPVSDFDSSTFEIASRKLTVNMVNSSRLPLKSSATGSGAEIATISFNLASPGVTPTMPLKDALATIGMERLDTHDVLVAPGGMINFDAKFQ